MKLAVMQPYLFPYIGYFQLIQAVDQFVALNDVQYIKAGWINRNRILENGEPAYFTFSLKKDSHQATIAQRVFADEFSKQKESFKDRVASAYRKAPCFEETSELLGNILDLNEPRLDVFVAETLKKICEHLEIKTSFVNSSEIEKDDSLKAEDRVIDINKRLGAEHYINLSGGMELYSKENFKQAGLQLNFIKCKEIKYQQFDNPFVPHLSILDVLMFNDKPTVQKFLNEYELI